MNELEPRRIPQFKRFEDLPIQWDKSSWRYANGSVDVYSIWNSRNHGEIAERLVAGQRCALYMMGTFGVGEFFQQGKGNFDILDEIKQRDRTQNLVVFANPEDIGDFIDFDRLPDNLMHLSDPKQRLALYPGPMHAIFPIKPETLPNSGLIRQADTSTAFFWIPGHTGYEKLADELKKRAKGLFGGGSLNIHGQEPSFTTVDLRQREMQRHPQWLSNIDFVILDEISESLDIGRSHTQVSFMNPVPQIVRIGSISKAKIETDTGYQLEDAQGLKLASSKTPYDDQANRASDTKVELAFVKMRRFEAALEMGELI